MLLVPDAYDAGAPAGKRSTEVTDSGMRLRCKTCLHSPVSPAMRQARVAMLANKDWQKFNLMSVFGSAPAIRSHFQLSINCYFPGAANGAGAEAGGRAGRVADTKQSQKWLVASTLGTKAARKMALEHKPRGWVPLAQVCRCFSGGRACLDPSWGAQAVSTRGSVCISVRVCVGGGPGGELQRGHAGRGRAALCFS